MQPKPWRRKIEFTFETPKSGFQNNCLLFTKQFLFISAEKGPFRLGSALDGIYL